MITNYNRFIIRAYILLSIHKREQTFNISWEFHYILVFTQDFQETITRKSNNETTTKYLLNVYHGVTILVPWYQRGVGGRTDRQTAPYTNSLNRPYTLGSKLALEQIT